jgi:hypothetical protein
MPNFIKKLLYDNRELEFHFFEIARLNSNRYHVKVTENGNPLTAFDMDKLGNGEWKVLPPAPDWVLLVEPLLSKSIQENCK